MQMNLQDRAFISGLAGWPGAIAADNKWHLSDIYRTGIFMRSDALCLCPTCKNIFLADVSTQEDPDICSACGNKLSAGKKGNRGNQLNENN